MELSFIQHKLIKIPRNPKKHIFVMTNTVQYQPENKDIAG